MCIDHHNHNVNSVSCNAEHMNIMVCMTRVIFGHIIYVVPVILVCPFV